MTTHRILQWWKDVSLGEGICFRLVPVQTYDEVGTKVFDAIVVQVQEAGFSYRITEQTTREIAHS